MSDSRDEKFKVGIMMPAYNAGEFIVQAIKSVQAQTYKNWTLVIVDDGSEDETYLTAKLAAVGDERIIVVKAMFGHAGCPTTRNLCMEHMPNDVEIIARMDADDVDDPTRIAKSVQHLLDNAGTMLVTTGFNWLTPGNGHTAMPGTRGMNKSLYAQNKGGRPASATVVAWRYVYTMVGPFNPKLIAGSDGEWMFRCIQFDFQWGFIEEVLYSQRRHDGQITARLGGLQNRVHNDAWKTYGNMPG